MQTNNNAIKNNQIERYLVFGGICEAEHLFTRNTGQEFTMMKPNSSHLAYWSSKGDETHPPTIVGYCEGDVTVQKFINQNEFLQAQASTQAFLTDEI